MEPNELDLLPTDGLVRLILSARDSRAQYVLPKHDDGVTLDFEQYGFLELSHELARRTTALQAQIDGMIERPRIDYESCESVTVNGVVILGDVGDAWWVNHGRIADNLTKALGMDDAKEGGEGEK